MPIPSQPQSTGQQSGSEAATFLMLPYMPTLGLGPVSGMQGCRVGNPLGMGKSGHIQGAEALALEEATAPKTG